jgi:membrane-bound serine protease (ClpP class)
MREIVQAMLSSPVPVVVYVAPAGARAGSAGVFITMAGHIAAMAPGTNIGAAHPVSIALPGASAPEGGAEETMTDKVTNDAAAYVRAIAQQRGRNVEWAEKAVRTSVSITAREAVENRVVDLMADSIDDLLTQVDGREVTTVAGQRTLHTRGVRINSVPMSLPEILLHILIDPDIAYLLFTIGLIAIVAELYHPGAILPGVTGVICLILAFVAFGTLPVNWAGVALIVFAIILFVADIKVAGFALSIGGAIAFVLGSLLLFVPFTPQLPIMPTFSVSPWLIALMTLLLTGFFLLVVSAGVRAQRARVTSGVQALVGAKGVATSDLVPQGTVLVRSEHWTAEAMEGPIRAGEEVQVIAAEGVRLKVIKKQ